MKHTQLILATFAGLALAQREISCEVAEQSNAPAQPKESSKVEATKPQFPPQREDENSIDITVTPQVMEELICNQFEEPKDECHPAMAQCIFEQRKNKDNLPKDNKFSSQKDFWQAVGECASKVLTLKGPK